MSSLCSMTLLAVAVLAQPVPPPPPAPPVPMPRSDAVAPPSKEIPQFKGKKAAEVQDQATDFVNQQISTMIKKKLMKKLPREMNAQFPFRLQEPPPEVPPEQVRAWVDASPNRVTFAGRLPEDLEEQLDIQILDRRAVAERRYQIDVGVRFPLREIFIRLDVPPGGFVFEGIHNDFHLFLTIDFEWDYVGEEDPRSNLFSFLNARDIGIFPGGTREYVENPEGEYPPMLLRGLDVQSKLDLRDLAITGVRGKPMYRNGRFVGNRGIFRLLADVANVGFDIASVASQENDLIERIAENAMNDALYDAQPKMIELANRELLVEETGPMGVKIKPVDILKEQLAKQAVPTLLPGKTEPKQVPPERQ